MWGLVAAAVCLIMPIYESRKHIAKIWNNLTACTPAESRQEAFADTAKAVLPPGATKDADVAAH